MNNFLMEDVNPNDIAIVGYSFKFPEAISKEELWDILISKKSVIGDLPKDRWEWPEWINVENTHIGINKGGYIKDIDKFDASFFKISPREAELMDPQQRLLLELSWELFEDSGYKISNLKSTKTGVYIGASGSDYELLIREQADEGFHKGTGTSTLGAIIPNRISYFFDFDGPSMLIDTACSSSLVAINEAVKSIRAGECVQAVAGGINIICHPGRSLAYYQSKMLSKDGKCYTFDKKANGFVRGEGAALIFLKTLKQALIDGDRICAVIKETSVNHGGQSSGLTVPDSNQQSKLIEEACKKGNIDVNSISYIEAHGTGTSLGDPIEVVGLTAAFNKLKDKNNKIKDGWCGLGSIKTNIGHLEAASGMAGLLKIILSMEQKILPATNNFEKLNPKLSLKNSPFYINNETKPWKPLFGNNEVRAGVSSFGLGGSNGHIILESFNKKESEKQENNTTEPYFFILSAKNKERIKEYAEKWLNYINSNSVDDLATLSFVLTTCREEFEERLAIIFYSINDLKTSIINFLDDKFDEKLFKGNIKSTSNSISFLENQPELVKDWLIEKNLEQLGKYWCFGLALNWNLLFDQGNRKKISLPTYPFARDRHWVEIKKAENIKSSKLHPLLHENVSNLREQKFVSVFSGNELFLSDHVVGTEKVLPGVAQIEMIREAGEKSIHLPITSIKNLNWIRPIQVKDKPVNVFISLFPRDEDVNFKIYTQENGEEVIYSNGKLNTNDINTNVKYDIQTLLEKFSSTKSKETCYSLLKEKNLNLGESYKGIKNIHYNSDEVLAEIELPKEEEFVFTPGILDSCLQSCLLWFLFRENTGLALPYSVKEIFIYGSLSKKLWCYSRKSKYEKDSQFEIYDIDILNENGELVISIKKFLFFPLNGLSNPIDTKTRKTDFPVSLFYPLWKSSEEEISFQKISSNTDIYLIGGAKELAKHVSEKLGVEVKILSEKGHYDYFIDVFTIIKQATKESKSKNIIFLYENNKFYDYAFISGLLKTVFRENNQIFGKIIGIDSLNKDRGEQIVDILKREIGSRENEIRYVGNTRNIKTYELIESQVSVQESIIKKGGVYIITGGVGGLGLIFTKYIRKVDKTKVILIGRSNLDASKKRLLSELENVTYHKVDVSNREEVISFIEKVKVDNKKINGIIHSAGVIKDNLILNKYENDIAEVLNPKIQGTINLDIATQYESIDFMVFFSSVAAVFGNIGQGDYASANAYLDHYAQYREELKNQGKRKGKTVSINWSFWDEGAMQVNSVGKKYFEDKWNMLPLPTQETIDVFEQLLSSNVIQGVIACGDKFNIKNTLIESTVKRLEETKKESEHAEKPINSDQLKENVIQQIREFTSVLLKSDVQSIMGDVEWGEFGFDSVVLTEFSNKINFHYDIDINPIIFYNYPTIELLVDYLINEYEKQIRGYHFISTNNIKSSYSENINLRKPRTSNLKDNVINKIVEFTSQLLKLDIHNIKTDVEWGDYGFDSVILTEFSNKLNAFYGLDLNPIIFYNCITVNDLVSHLIDQYEGILQNKHKYASTETEIKKPQNKQEPIISTRLNFQSISSNITAVHRTLNISKSHSAPIAIIGISGRLPGSSSLDNFWENIRDKKDLITEIPSERWDWKEYYGDPKTDVTKTKAKWGGFIKDIDKFDSLYFNISPREAQLMDPQQRITLETVYSALEDAGIASNTIKGSNTGVFIGVASSDYSVLLNRNSLFSEAHFTTGGAYSILANRISYLLDIHGPSEPIDTACSSSLIAIHRAVENIRNGSCNIAIAGGVNAIITPQRTLSFSQAGMLSEDGRCKTFDRRANGYVRAEGVGIVILKSLEQAEIDGDRIYGVIRSTSENHGGKANTLTSPNPVAHKNLLIKAYQDADIDPRDVSYIEAHGTGTPLGDPIEIEGLKSAFTELYKQKGLSVSNSHCGIGSVKTNIGHLEAAAGIAGILKIIYAIKNKTLPGNPNLKEVNEYLKLDNTPFYLLRDTIPWETDSNKPRIAGISSFGFGGVNAHIIIEEYISMTEQSYSSKDSSIIVLSAKDKERLKEQVFNLKKHIEENPSLSLYDIAYTLQEGRNSMEERLALIVSDKEELIKELSYYLEGRKGAVFQGNTKEGKSDFLLQGGAGQAYINYAIKNKESKSLAQLWVKGVEIDWKLLYPDQKPNKISLPTYPFLRERHWVKTNTFLPKENNGISKLHPLLHCNESNFEEQKFTSTYTGDEFFLRDHMVNKTKVLPGVAYIELVREAVVRSTEGKTINQIKNITWLSPIKLVSEEKKIHTNIYINEDSFDFEVYSATDSENVIHSIGKVNSVIHIPTNKIDISIIQSRCIINLDGMSFYEEVDKVGVNLGSSFKGIKRIYYNEYEALSQIELEVKKGFILPPGILDSAIQTYVGIDMTNYNRITGLPYRIKEVNIYHSLENISKCWTYVKKKEMDTQYNTPHFDIDIIDSEGNILIGLKDLIILSFNNNDTYTVNQEETEILSLYNSKWTVQQIQ